MGIDDITIIDDFVSITNNFITIMKESDQSKFYI